MLTHIEAQAALEAHTQVEAGEGEDHDIGRIISIENDMATVAWQSGVRTPCRIADLSIMGHGPVPENWMDPESWTDRAPNPHYRRSASDPE